MYWRDYDWINEVYGACLPIKLPEGVLVPHHNNAPVQFMSEGVYHQVCYKGVVPMLNTNIGVVLRKVASALPIVHESWNAYTRSGDRGLFAYSVVSIIYSISMSAVITWFLTIFVLTNYTIKPSLLLKLSTVVLSVYLLITVVKCIVMLHKQQRNGYLHGAEFLDHLNSSTYLSIIDLIVVILLQISQVQVIMRIFLRQKDKRVSFLVGVAASVLSQVIWAVTKFHRFDNEDDAGEILPAFIYLVRIAMALCYAALISVYQISKINYIIANKDIWLLLLLTFILIYTPVAFFVADITNAFVYELSEIFSVVCYVICVVIPWEWCNKMNIIMRRKEKDGVLGRRFYEDELYELDKYEVFFEPAGDLSDNDEPKQTIYKEKPKSRFVKTCHTARDAFLTLTDTIIATGLAIPRSVSVSTPSIHHDNVDTSRAQPLETPSRRHDVFVYSRREVIIDLTDDETTND